MAIRRRNVKHPQRNAEATTRNLIAGRVRDLRETRRGEVIDQIDLAEEIQEAILELAPLNSPVRKRGRFNRSDLAKVEAGSRYVRDYELLAIARVFDLPVQELLGLPQHGIVDSSSTQPAGLA